MKPTDEHSDFAAELAAFNACLAASRAAGMEEAVPADMMQVFSDEQWPELLFEFQPSLQLFTARRDIVRWSRRKDQGEKTPLPESGAESAWVIFLRGDEQLVRPLGESEHEALKLARSGMNFAGMAAALWPDDETEAAHHRMTELLLRWLDEGLVIDAGVPLPADAEYAD